MEEIAIARRSSVAGVGSWDVRIDECAHGPGGEEIFVRFESWKMVECEREPGNERIEKWKIESGKWEVEK